MPDPAGTPPVRDDIQHRPDDAQSSEPLRPMEGDPDARGTGSPPPRDWVQGRPRSARVDPGRPAGGPVSSIRHRLGVQTIPPGTPEHIEAKIRRIETLADWLDTKFVIPVINWPIGLDGIVGLIPGVGDTITTGLSGYLIYEAHQAGARTGTLGRMGWNVAVDWALGLIPLVGDVFDVAHKANAKNARLLLDELRRNQTDMKLRAAERGTGV